MDQMKIGKFIAELRKEQHMTQLDLAKKLSITDRAISKWENGRGLPDISLIKPLCEVFSISINELLSGERIAQKDLYEKAEETIIDTLQHSEKSLKKTKRRFFWVLLSAAACILIALFVSKSVGLFVRYRYPNKEFFGEEYIQIVYPTSITDYITARVILKDVDQAFSTITTAESAEEDFGELSRFCIIDEEATNENHRVNFIAARFRYESGYIWFEYDSEGYDKNGKITCGSWDILTRLELKKIDNQWMVVSVKEGC